MGMLMPDSRSLRLRLLMLVRLVIWCRQIWLKKIVLFK